MDVRFFQFRLVQAGEAAQTSDNIDHTFAAGVDNAVGILNHFNGCGQIAIIPEVFFILRLERFPELLHGAFECIVHAVNRADRGIDLVSNPGDQHAKGGHLFRLHQLCLGIAQISVSLRQFIQKFSFLGNVV